MVDRDQGDPDETKARDRCVGLHAGGCSRAPSRARACARAAPCVKWGGANARTRAALGDDYDEFGDHPGGDERARAQARPPKWRTAPRRPRPRRAAGRGAAQPRAPTPRRARRWPPMTTRSAGAAPPMASRSCTSTATARSATPPRQCGPSTTTAATMPPRASASASRTTRRRRRRAALRARCSRARCTRVTHVLVADERDAAPDGDGASSYDATAAGGEQARAAWRPRAARARALAVYARARAARARRGWRYRQALSTRVGRRLGRALQLLPADAHSPYCVLKPQEVA